MSDEEYVSEREEEYEETEGRFIVEDDDPELAEAPGEDNTSVIEEYQATCGELIELERRRENVMPPLKALMDDAREALRHEMVRRKVMIVKIPEVEVVVPADDNDEDGGEGADGASQYSMGSQGVGKRRFLRISDKVSNFTINEQSIKSMFEPMRVSSEHHVRGGFDMVVNMVVQMCRTGGREAQEDADEPARKKTKKKTKPTVSAASSAASSNEASTTAFHVEGEEDVESDGDVGVNIADAFLTCFEKIMKATLYPRVPHGKVEVSKSKMKGCLLSDMELEEHFDPFRPLYHAWMEAKSAYDAECRIFREARQQLVDAKGALTERVAFMAPDAILEQLGEMDETDKKVFMATSEYRVEVTNFFHKTSLPVKTAEFMTNVKNNIGNVISKFMQVSPIIQLKRSSTPEDVREELIGFGWHDLVNDMETAVLTWRRQIDVVVEKELKVKIKRVGEDE